MRKLFVILIVLGLTSITIFSSFVALDQEKSTKHTSNDKVKLALFVTLKAKPGKEADVEKFLHSGLPIVLQEKKTITWYAIRMDKSTFAIFDTFTNEEGRQAHLSGKVAEALMANAPELLATAPTIEKVEVLTSK